MTLAVAILGLVVLGLLSAVVLLSLRASKRAHAPEVAAFQDKLATMEIALKGLESRVTESAGSVRESLSRDIQEARLTLAGIKVTQEERHRIEEEMRQATRRIEQVLGGTGSRGQAGENILAEAFRQFPPGLIEPDFRVKGKVVEYALVLPSGRRLAIDSRWPNPELLTSLATAEPQQHQALANKLEDAIERKAQEVAKYIDPATTAPFAIAAIPDSAFAVCCKAHHEAYRYSVILMPYSMAIPYLLALYRLHLQYGGGLEAEKVAAYVGQLENGLRQLDEDLDNRVQKGATMVLNAYQQGKSILGSLRQSISYLQAPPTISGPEKPPPTLGGTSTP